MGAGVLVGSGVLVGEGVGVFTGVGAGVLVGSTMVAVGVGTGVLVASGVGTSVGSGVSVGDGPVVGSAVGSAVGRGVGSIVAGDVGTAVAPPPAVGAGVDESTVGVGASVRSATPVDGGGVWVNKAFDPLPQAAVNNARRTAERPSPMDRLDTTLRTGILNIAPHRPTTPLPGVFRAIIATWHVLPPNRRMHVSS